MKGEKTMKIIKNERGFTLIEMLVVLLIISMILLIVIPNVTKHSSTINDKGCEALKSMLATQVQAYEIEHNEDATISEMKKEGYLSDHHVEEDKVKCPNGNFIEISDVKNDKKTSE